MNFKSSVYNNYLTGIYDVMLFMVKVLLFAIAKETLVFILLSFWGHWKYPVRYVLVDKVSADDLNYLLSRIINLCARNNINVRCITVDGTAVNSISMKLFGVKLGHSLEKITGGFTNDGYDYKLYFIPDPPFILNLALDVRGELRIFLDNKFWKIEWKLITLLHEK